MGQSKSRHSVLVLGAPESGKTRFINLLLFGDDCPYMGPTCGKCAGIYDHNGVTEFEFVEFGGRNHALWGELLERVDRVDAVYCFYRATDTTEHMQTWHTRVLQLLNTAHIAPSVPIVVVLYILDGTPDTQAMQRARQALQLRVLQHGRSVLLTQMIMGNHTQLVVFIQHMLDWTHEHVR